MLTQKQTNVIIIIVGFVLLVGGFFIGWFFGKENYAVYENETIDPYDYIKENFDKLNESSETETIEEMKKTVTLLSELSFTNKYNTLGIKYKYLNSYLEVEEIYNKDLFGIIYPGDRITKYEDNLIKNLNEKDISDKLLENKTHRITVINHENTEKEYEISYTYNKKQSSLKQLDDSTLYIKFDSLKKGLYEEFYTEYNNYKTSILNKENSKLIIDLRNVVSGSQTEVGKLVKLFMKINSNNAISFSPINNSNTSYQYGGINTDIKYSMHVLVNEKTDNYGVALALALAKEGTLIGRLQKRDNYLYETIDFVNKNITCNFKGYTYKIDNKHPLDMDIEIRTIASDFLSFTPLAFYNNIEIDSVSNLIKNTQFLISDYSNQSLRVDGYFDNLTKLSINALQSLNGITETNNFDYQTYQLIMKVYYDNLESYHSFDSMIKEAYAN